MWKFAAGDVIKIFYFMNLTKHRRMFVFSGICTNLNKKTKTFTLKNFFGSEFVTFTFIIGAPNIVAIDLLTSYNFKFKQSKLHNIKKFRLIGKTDLFSAKFFERRRDALSYFYIPSTIFPKEKKRLRNKFRL